MKTIHDYSNAVLLHNIRCVEHTFKELEIILSDFTCDKNCPYCTAKITKWPVVKDDIHMLSLYVGQLKELGYKFHYVTIGGNGEPTMHDYNKLKDIVEMFDDYDISIKRVLTSGNIFRDSEKEKYDLFVSHGWIFEVTVVGFDWNRNKEIQRYNFNYFETEEFKKARIRLNYVLLKDNIHIMPKELKDYATNFPNIETLAVKLLNVNTFDESLLEQKGSKWIIENGIPKSEREVVASILNKNFEYLGEAYDTHSWKMKIKNRETEVYFSWKKLSYGFSDLVWYGNKFVNYQLEEIKLPDVLPKIYIASKFIKERLDGKLSFKNDFRTKLIGNEKDFVDFNNHSFIKDLSGNLKYQYLGPFYNEKASDGSLTSTACEEVVSTENALIDKCDIFIVYFDKELSPGSITELIYAAFKKKKIEIYYKKEDDVSYELKSSNWYPIVSAIQIAGFKNVKTKIVKNESEVLKEIIKS